MNAQIINKGLAALAVAAAIPVAILSGCADSAPKRPATAAAGPMASESSNASAAPVVAAQDSNVAAVIDFAKQTEPAGDSDAAPLNQPTAAGERHTWERSPLSGPTNQ